MQTTPTDRGTTRTLMLLTLVATFALVLSACAGDGADTTADETVGGEETAADTTDQDTADDTADDAADEDMDGDMAGVTVAVAPSDLGDIVVDGEGRTLYMFVPDDQGDPTCTDDCAATWPPLEGPATAGDGADDGLLAAASHPSGVTQVTYNGWPLYHFANDQAAGDTNGQGLNDVWFVLGPDGEPIRDANAAGDEDVGY